MKRLITIIFCLTISYANSQNAIHRFKNFIRATPFAILDTENPSIRFAYEKKLNNKFGLEIGVGYIYTLYDYKERKSTDSQNFGYILSLEARNYFSTNKQSNEMAFWGIRGVFINSDNTRKMTFNTKSPINGLPNNSVEFVRFQKRIYGVQLILGGKFTVTDNFFLESIIGVGTSYRQINNNLPEHHPDPVFDRNLRAVISNRNYDNWFTPYPYFQIHIGWGW